MMRTRSGFRRLRWATGVAIVASAWSASSAGSPAVAALILASPSHFWPTLAVLGFLLFLALATAALFACRARRRRAEAEAERLRGELAHAGRVTVMGQFASSLA